MALTKTKLKNDFKEQLEGKKKKKENDPRVLNYFDLSEGEKMKVLLIPDANGNLLTTYETHGPNMDVFGAGNIRCSRNSGDVCPACTISYNNKDINKYENQRWRSKETIFTQCVVLDSPVEVPDSPDDNLVKLVYLPSKVRDVIKEAIAEELIDDPTEHALFIKKTVNEGGRNSYENSYFIQKPFEPSDELQEAVDAGLVRPYDFEQMEAEGDLIPQKTTADDVQAWIDKVHKLETGKTNPPDNDDGDDAAPATRSASSTQGNASSDSNANDGQSSSAGSSIKDKLQRYRQNNKDDDQ